MYYSCKDKSLSETSGFQEKITADGMNNLVLKQEALQIYYEHNYYIANKYSHVFNMKTKTNKI